MSEQNPPPDADEIERARNLVEIEGMAVCFDRNHPYWQLLLAAETLLRALDAKPTRPPSGGVTEQIDEIRERHEGDDYRFMMSRVRAFQLHAEDWKQVHNDRATLLDALDLEAAIHDALQNQVEAWKSTAQSDLAELNECRRERNTLRVEVERYRRECVNSASRIHRMLADELPDDETYADLPLIHDALQLAAGAVLNPTPESDPQPDAEENES